MTDIGNVVLHPVLEEMHALGCKSKRKVSLALKVYLDLCEVKAMWSTQYSYNRNLDIIYITGKWSRNDAVIETIVPLSASSSVSPAWLFEIQNVLCSEEKRKIVTLAFVAGDSSICYYRTCDGLQPPDSPETVNKRRCQEERRQCRAVDMIQKSHDMMSEMMESNSLRESRPVAMPNE